MNREKYLSDLAAHLQQRGLVDQRINDIVTEVENHLTDSGEAPLDAFGPVDQYAEKIAVQDEDAMVAENQPQWHTRTFRATAFDEMGILAVAGQDGWELVDVGALALFCRRPRDTEQFGRWEYKRRIGRHRTIIMEEMASERWEPCGNWLPFHYFKRRVG